MPRKIKNAVETEFKADDRMTRSLGVMSRGMRRLNRMAGRVKKGLMATGRAAIFVGRQSARVARVGLLAMAGAAAVVLVSVNKLAGGMDELAKTTRAIDFDIEKFQEFRFVAEQTGVNGDKFGSIMKKFSATVGEFKGGYGTMFTALKKLNPQLARQMKQTKSTSDAFELYMTAIRESPNVLKRTALASAAFGKRMGIDMINMANLSAQELEKLRLQMRANGVVTEEQAKKAEDFNDSVNRLKLTAKGLAVDALTPLMPLLEKGSDRLRDWIIENKALISQKVHKVFDKIVEFGKKAFSWLKANVPPLIDQLQRIGRDGFAWIRDNKKDLKDFGHLIMDIGKALVKVAQFVIRHKEAVLVAVAAYKLLGISMSAINFSQMTAGMAQVGGAVGGVSTKVGALAGMLGKGGLLVTAAAAGAAIGYAIFQEWNRSASSLALAAENTAARVSLAFHNMGNEQLEASNRMLEQQERRLDSFWSRTKALLSGNIQAHNEAIDAVKDARIKGLEEQRKRLIQSAPKEALPQRIKGARVNFGNLAERLEVESPRILEVSPHLDKRSRGELLQNSQPMQQLRRNDSPDIPQQAAPVQAKPQAQVSRSETVKKEVIELRIRDDKNRADVTRSGDTTGLTLSHTGGMG